MVDKPQIASGKGDISDEKPTILDRLYSLLKKSVALLCFGLGLLVLTLSHYLPVFFEASSLITFLSKLLEHIGVAILIATFVGWTIDAIHRKELAEKYRMIIGQISEKYARIVDEFKGNAFCSAYRWSIPDVLLDAVQKQIFNLGLVRLFWKATYRLREITPGEKAKITEDYPEYPFDRRLVVDLDIVGEIENRQVSTIEEPLYVYLEKEDASAFNRCTFFEIEEKGGGFRVKYEGDDLNQLQVTVDNAPDDAMRYSAGINNIYRTPPIKFSPGKSYKVTTHCTYLRGSRYAREVWSIGLPTLEIEVTVIPEVEGLHIFGELLSPFSFRRSPQGESRLVFSSCNPSLPHQGFMVWWHNGDVVPSAVGCAPPVANAEGEKIS